MMAHRFCTYLYLTLAAACFAISRVNGKPSTTPKHMKIQQGAPPTQPYSDLLDMTQALGPKVAAFNRLNPDAPIKLLAKAEFRNPASKSHKDRIARAMITKAEERGELRDAQGNKKTSEWVA